MEKFISSLVIALMLSNTVYAATSSSTTGTTTTTSSTTNDSDYTSGLNGGKILGDSDGQATGKKDFFAGKSNDYLRAFPASSLIIEKFLLNKETTQYKVGFVDGYSEAYMTGYKSAYTTAHIEYLKSNFKNEGEATGYTSIDMFGGIVESADSIVKLNFNQGAVYLKNNIVIEKNNENLGDSLDSRYVQVSDVYNIKVGNEKGVINLYDAIQLSFKYIGPENVGIYKKTSDGWGYLVTKINSDSEEEVTLDTEINSKEFLGGQYVVLIDKQNKSLLDIEQNWAKDEIIFAFKRGYIDGYQDQTFKPKSNITRAEFMVIMDKYLNWNTVEIKQDEEVKFLDAPIIPSWAASSIKKGIKVGIINGYTDGTFRPNQYITYQEIEWMIKKIKSNENFAWDDISQDMIEKKGIISKGIGNKKIYITREEVAFLLYMLQ